MICLPLGRLWYGVPSRIPWGYANFYSPSHTAVIRTYDAAGNLIETHDDAGEFRKW
ncbi:MAG: hypothetical protein DME59_09460 [Verrucomicrobia bacterium]|nr:MAG: hypothetical protein DME59_09460 [Verrucomicrobiota bacterium]